MIDAPSIEAPTLISGWRPYLEKECGYAASTKYPVAPEKPNNAKQGTKAILNNFRVITALHGRL